MRHPSGGGRVPGRAGHVEDNLDGAVVLAKHLEREAAAHKVVEDACMSLGDVILLSWMPRSMSTSSAEPSMCWCYLRLWPP